MNEYISLAEMGISPKDKEDKAYWISFEYDNGSIGTWATYARSPDDFIEKFLQQNRHVKRLISFEEQVDGWPVEKNRTLSIDTYNRRLVQLRGKESKAGQYGPHHISFEAEEAYRRGFHQALAIVVMLLEKNAPPNEICEWEHNVLVWRNALTKVAHTITTPDMYMPQTLGELIYQDYQPAHLPSARAKKQ